MSRITKVLKGTVLPTASMLVIAACSSSDPAPAGGPPPPPPPPTTATFEVTVSNLTNAQPLSPVAVVAHTFGYQAFTVGTTATPGLEVLAEAGDNGDFLDEADNHMVTLLSTSGAAPIGPAGSETISIEIDLDTLPDAEISLATMLVNTNDAITGVNAQAVGDMALGDSVTLRTIAYDAGTEANTESAQTIPGPAAGGEGFNAARDDVNDFVTMHTGVVTADDGLTGSGLTEAHRFDNPVMQVTLTRTQ